MQSKVRLANTTEAELTSRNRSELATEKALSHLREHSSRLLWEGARTHSKNLKLH